MSANRIVQAHQHLSTSAPADTFCISSICEVTRQHRRIRWSPRQARKVLHTTQQCTQATLQTDGTGEATELCKLHLQQQLVGVNRGIFGVKVRRLIRHFCCTCGACSLSLPNLLCKGSSPNSESAWQAAKFEAIETLLSELQQSAVDQHPTEDLTQLSGKWNLVYTSLVIKVVLSDGLYLIR